MKTAAPATPETDRRLLEAAGAVFAERGFRGATVREICVRAGANVAAVNYHYRDKGRLYAAVLRHAHRAAMEQHPPDLGLGPRPTPRERLAAFVRSFLLRLLDEGRPAWHGRLMAREMADPTPALDALVEAAIRPTFERLLGIVRDLLGPRARPETVRDVASSVVGQCLFYRHARAVIERLDPGRKFGRAEIDRLAGHVTRFSLAGLRAAGTRR